MAALGLGLAALGRPGYMTLGHARDFASTAEAAMEAQTFAVLDAAWAAGIRHVDTARSYGLAERFLANWLAARGRTPTELTISSKWGYRYTANWSSRADVHEVKDHSLAHLQQQYPESRALLGDFLRVYQVHSATLESGVLTDDAVLDELARLRDAGIGVGLTATGPHQSDIIDTAMLVSRGGRRLFDWVQATWNVLEPSCGPALARAKRLGVHTIAKEGVANGRLTSRSHFPQWQQFAAKHEATPDALALSVALAQPFLDVVLSGAATVEQLTSNLAATPRSIDVSAFATPPEDYWAARSKLEWS
jgi:aryl-alcohol dehydrogenase-like predicted oxidoreductase